MSKKLTAEERKKLAQELIAADLDFDLDILGPFKEPKKSLKTPIEKVDLDQLIRRSYLIFLISSFSLFAILIAQKFCEQLSKFGIVIFKFKIF